MTLIIKKIDDSRKGVFTDRAFNTNDVVTKFHGQSLTLEEVKKLPLDKQSNVLQIGDNNFLNLEKETSYFINHNCNPNCFIKAVVNSAFLVALRPIDKNEEITFDYSITSTDIPQEWSMPCSCHKYQCRKSISGFASLDAKKKEELVKKKVVPRYILNKHET